MFLLENTVKWFAITVVWYKSFIQIAFFYSIWGGIFKTIWLSQNMEHWKPMQTSLWKWCSTVLTSMLITAIANATPVLIRCHILTKLVQVSNIHAARATMSSSWRYATSSTVARWKTSESSSTKRLKRYGALEDDQVWREPVADTTAAAVSVAQTMCWSTMNRATNFRIDVTTLIERVLLYRSAPAAQFIDHICWGLQGLCGAARGVGCGSQGCYS